VAPTPPSSAPHALSLPRSRGMSLTAASPRGHGHELCRGYAGARMSSATTKQRGCELRRGFAGAHGWLALPSPRLSLGSPRGCPLPLHVMPQVFN
jgi:hypothetical protein